MNQEQHDASMATSRSLQTCDVLTDDFKAEPFTIVIFGGAGDLAKRMLLPTLYHLHRDGRLPKDFSVVGFGLPEMSDEAYRHFAHDSLKQFSSEPVAEKDWKAFSHHLVYLSADFSDDEGYKTLHTLLGDICVPTPQKKKEVIFYLAVPPSVAPTIITKLGQHKLCTGTFDPKIVMEKPFGRDRASAVELNRTILSVFDEKQVYRIDHFLGKETVQNIMFFRFANSIFEPLWDRRYIDHVQITVAEQIGVENRGLFYEQTGVVRDMVQNHILQLVALVAMEHRLGLRRI